MANFTPNKKTAQDFNNGVKYIDGIGEIGGDAVHAESINNVIESVLYTQEQADNAVAVANRIESLATNQPNTINANNVGVPNVEIEDTANGKRFKFSNLKGQAGTTPNIAISATVSNTTGIPSVTIKKSGTETNPKFDLEFSNLKGDKGNSIFYGFDVINGKLIVTSAVDDDVNIKINNGHLVFDI